MLEQVSYILSCVKSNTETTCLLGVISFYGPGDRQINCRGILRFSKILTIRIFL
jgi:hypothetical protein